MTFFRQSLIVIPCGKQVPPSDRFFRIPDRRPLLRLVDEELPLFAASECPPEIDSPPGAPALIVSAHRHHGTP